MSKKNTPQKGNQSYQQKVAASNARKKAQAAGKSQATASRKAATAGKNATNPKSTNVKSVMKRNAKMASQATTGKSVPQKSWWQRAKDSVKNTYNSAVNAGKKLLNKAGNTKVGKAAKWVANTKVGKAVGAVAKGTVKVITSPYRAAEWCVKKAGNTKFGKWCKNNAASKWITKNVSKGVLGKGAAKTILKKIPAVSAVVGAGLAVYEASRGNWGRAGMELVSGAAGCFPPIGTAASLAVDAAIVGYDIHEINQKEKAQEAAKAEAARKAAEAKKAQEAQRQKEIEQQKQQKMQLEREAAEAKKRAEEAKAQEEQRLQQQIHSVVNGGQDGTVNGGSVGNGGQDGTVNGGSAGNGGQDGTVNGGSAGNGGQDGSVNGGSAGNGGQDGSVNGGNTGNGGQSGSVNGGNTGNSGQSSIGNGGNAGSGNNGNVPEVNINDLQNWIDNRRRQQNPQNNSNNNINPSKMVQISSSGNTIVCERGDGSRYEITQSTLEQQMSSKRAKGTMEKLQAVVNMEKQPAGLGKVLGAYIPEFRPETKGTAKVNRNLIDSTVKAVGGSAKATSITIDGKKIKAKDIQKSYGCTKKEAKQILKAYGRAIEDGANLDGVLRDIAQGKHISHDNQQYFAMLAQAKTR